MAKMKDTPWAVEILAEGADILNKLKLRWWIEAGTLLGIYREGKLLDQDDADIDVSILEPVDHGAIEKAFTSKGYEVLAQGSHQIVFVKKDVYFDISFYVKDGRYLINYIIGAGQAKQHWSLFKHLGTIKFKGRTYPAPCPIEEYLARRYGDWRIPRKEKLPWTLEGETLPFIPEGITRVITYGTFDTLHYGHIRLLQRAKTLGNYLIVGLSTDKFNHEKGKKAYFNYYERLMDLEGVGYVDAIIPEESWEQKKDDIKKYDVDTLVMGDDWAGKFDDLDCRVVYLRRTPKISASKIRSIL